MKIKMPPEKYGLCSSCTNGVIIKTTKGVTVHCTWLDKQMRDIVEQCSKYYDAGAPSLEAMKSTAWILDSDKRDIGFLPNKKWRKRHPDQVDDLEELGG